MRRRERQRGPVLAPLVLALLVVALPSTGTGLAGKGLADTGWVSTPLAAAEEAGDKQAATGEAGEVATVYVVRHAEKQTGDDPGLTAAGEERARQLAHVLADAGIDAVFSTDRIRTRETAAPVAAAAGVSPQLYASADEVAGAIRERSGGDSGDAFLVVGHSNTLDDVAASLGVSGLLDLDESEYDRLYVIHLHPSGAFLERLRFGAPSHVDGSPAER